MRIAICFLFAALVAGTSFAAELPAGSFTNDNCVECHHKETPGLVSAWRAGPHANNEMPDGCVACHGDRHLISMETARKNITCITCHGGEGSTVSRSYFTSKHGVIVKLEEQRWNWSKPLADANYRAPTCAYCHMHEGGHGLAANDEAVDIACNDCHAPRYTEVITQAGKRALEIGSLKVTEAETAIRSFLQRAGVSKANATELEAMASRMRNETLASLRQGLGHHSPDYQWWYGQAALDGDLIRIKARITRLHRENLLRDKSSQ